MNKLAVIVALAALGLAAYAHLEAEQRQQRLDEVLQSNNDLRDKLTAFEVQLENALGGAEAPSMLAGSAPAAGDPVPGPDSSAGLAVRKPASPLERLASLEKTVASQRETIARLEKETVAESTAPRPVQHRMPDNVYFNVDQAAKALALDERQTSDMKDALARGKAELEDLYKIENDEGLTWNEVRKPRMANLGGGGDGAISIAMPDFAKIKKFKQSRIPGSSETFGEAERRIREQTFANVRRTLPVDKAEKWDKAHKDGLLRGSGGGVTFASVVLGDD